MPSYESQIDDQGVRREINERALRNLRRIDRIVKLNHLRIAMICRVTKDSSGVGLIEILAAMSVILILSALVLPRIRRFLEFYALDSAIQTLSSNLEVARYSAISRRCNAVAQFNASASSYEVFEDKNGNGAKDSAERTFGSYSLPRRVLFSGANLKRAASEPQRQCFRSNQLQRGSVSVQSDRKNQWRVGNHLPAEQHWGCLRADL